jgi:hypothetical protein
MYLDYWNIKDYVFKVKKTLCAFFSFFGFVFGFFCASKGT